MPFALNGTSKTFVVEFVVGYSEVKVLYPICPFTLKNLTEPRSINTVETRDTFETVDASRSLEC